MRWTSAHAARKRRSRPNSQKKPPPAPLKKEPIARNPIGPRTLGSLGLSSMGEASSDESTVETTENPTPVPASHRQRLLGRWPSGNTRKRNRRRPAGKIGLLIQSWGHAAHLVSPADRPLMSSLRIAMWVVMPL